MSNYRIKELDGVFTIEGSYEFTWNEGTWYKKRMKTVTKWSILTESGRISGAIHHQVRHYFSALSAFKSLDKAQEHLDKHILKTKPLEDGIDTPIYHTVKNQ